MTRPILLIFSLLCCTFSFGQTKGIYGVTLSTVDTSFWYKHQIKQLNNLSLPLLDTSCGKEFYRLWTSRQVIEIWQEHNGTFGGRVITWTDEYVLDNEKPTNRTYTKVTPLTSDTAQFVRQLFLSSGILNMPTGDSIRGWQQGFDGIEYIIERSTNGASSFKTYRTPKAQNSLKEAMQVQAFVDNAFSLVNAQQIWQSFTKTIPYECYINGGPGVACKVLTAKQRKKYIKERKNYRQHIHLPSFSARLQ